MYSFGEMHPCTFSPPEVQTLRVSSPVLHAHNCTFYKYSGIAGILQVLSKKCNFSMTSLYKAIVLMYWDVRLKN